ncbi:MAG: 16S rRNA (uracil(1498)-N(3))-methyltransferase [Ruminococcaceae bacterium]|nr:16S rRNA (uracil(1498)-N(3))-methyltransferase [Oscillospiraceae bacterium]
MPRFFKEFFDAAPFIEGDDAHHIIRSLRMRPGEHLTVCDTHGIDYHCTITDCSNDRVELKIDRTEKTQSEPSCFVSLFQCLPKGDKMDSVIKQSVELGVGEITPVLSTNCVSRPDEKQLSKKVERWQKIANEAAGQSGRGILPKVNAGVSLKQLSTELDRFDKAFFCYELGGAAITDALPEGINKIAIIVGPEGGFTANEAEMLELAGATVTTLGPRILRTETAPLAALTAIMLTTGNMK